MNFTKLGAIARAIQTGEADKVTQAIDAALEGETGKNWKRDLGKLRDVITTGIPAFSVIKLDGNSKLPFVAFSSLPGKGFCPGAGDCLRWCYSFRAWRYPAAFARQAQNSWLMRANPAAILEALDAIKREEGEEIDLRLYVDGDFRTVAELVWWMEALRTRPWLRTYGYSKSWREFLSLDAAGFAWPSNYLLNLSGGSSHGPGIKRAMSALTVTRGSFEAVSMGRKVKASDHGDRGHQKALREAYGAKAFTCPGKCGECTPKGHACGSERFRNVPIIIAVH